MSDNIHDVVDRLHPSLIRFIRDLSNEDLIRMRNDCAEVYDNIDTDVSAGKVRSLRSREVDDGHVFSKSREVRQAAGVRKLFSEFDKLAPLTDVEFAEVVQAELWAMQSLYSRESALLEQIIERLLRSKSGALPPTSTDELSALVSALR